MLKNSLRIAFRNIRRLKTYTFINIFGLSVGMACCIVIFLFIQHELSYDRFHKNAERIYRVEMMMKLPIGDKHYTIVRSDLLPLLVNEYPEVTNAVRLDSRPKTLTSYREKKFNVSALYADPSFFDIFTFPLLRGDAGTALSEPYTVVLTENLAEKLFPEGDPFGKIINVDNRADFRVTGVMQDMPDNSHFKADFVTSYLSLKGVHEVDFTLLNTYVLLGKGASSKELEEKLPAFVRKYFGEKRAEKDRYFLRPITSIHLNSYSIFELEENSSIKYSYYFALLAFFIILLAIINYMNLSTAYSLRRSKEVGIRKAVGAQRPQLIMQFLIESMLMSFLAMLLAVCLAELILPFFNSIVGKNLKIDFSRNLFFYFGLLVIMVFVGFLSGSYPALFLSSFQPSNVLRGEFGRKFGNLSLRKVLVIFQFSISIIFIIGASVSIRQLDFVRKKDLGFERENVVVTSLYKLERRPEVFKDELLKNPNIKSVTLCGIVPGIDYDWTSLVLPQGFARDEALKIPVFSVDDDYFETFKMEIVEGRSFRSEVSTDAGSAVVVNERAAERFGWETAVGKRLYLDREEREVTIVGVVRDFHLESLHREIGPYIFYYNPSDFTHAAIRISSDTIPQTISFIKDTWQEVAPNEIFEYEFVDEQVSRLYAEDLRSRKIFVFSAFLTVLIACLGLFGLASYTAETRTKEIGVRKVLGASVTGIILLLSRDFFKWVLAANLIAWPVAYYVMSKWLQGFAYRISIGLWTFFLAAAVALIISLFTISYQAIKSALANPVESLRYE